MKNLYRSAQLRVLALVKKGYEKSAAIKKACNEYGIDYGIYLLSYPDALQGA